LDNAAATGSRRARAFLLPLYPLRGLERIYMKRMPPSMAATGPHLDVDGSKGVGWYLLVLSVMGGTR
jgi:hypothetical protein